MELVIRESDGVTSDFVNYLVDKIIPAKMRQLLNKKKLEKWDDYLFKNKKSDLFLGSFHNTYDIIMFGVNNLSVSEYNGYYTVGVNPVENITGTNTKISVVCRLINYGNADVSGYMIFSDVFREVRKELSLYKNMYIMGIS